MKVKANGSTLRRLGTIVFFIPQVGKVKFNFAKNFILTNKDLNVMMEEHTEKAAAWRHYLALLKSKLRTKRRELEEIEAQAYLFHRDQFYKNLVVGDNRGGPTERYLLNCVAMANHVSEERVVVEKLQDQVDLLEAIREGFTDRRTALMSLGADLREHRKPTHILRKEE